MGSRGLQRRMLQVFSLWLRGGQIMCQQRGIVALSCGSASFSTQTTDHAQPVLQHNKSVLVRDYIHSALYDPQSGYFSAKAEAVGTISEPIQFSLLQGRKAYLQHLNDLYKQNNVSWFTPIEIFQPWYGYAIAEYILRTLVPASPLNIYEIGGGTGTCASNILNYFKTKAPAIYKNLTYTSVEISDALALKQQARVGAMSSHSHHFQIRHGSASDPNTWGTVNTAPCFIIMLEVLDNLAHDLVYRKTLTSDWNETWVTESAPGSYREELQPLEDPLIKRCLDVISQNPHTRSSSSIISAAKSTLSQFVSLSELAWIPTGCLQMLETLHKFRPNMVLIISDFSSLPDITIAGTGAPLVASKEAGQTKDHSSYLEAKGNVDIFFPTNFGLLQQLDSYVAERASGKDGLSERLSTVVTSAEFMEQCADVEKTKTKDGYNPLLEDYSNTKFYISFPE
ncbi:hypothetical protein CY35_03G082200 [Sphagnum magellanicum]|nr:hypothetical protein CY35_03G082200 [Sphagnum magellanicum]